MTNAFRINIRQYALDGPSKRRTQRTMPKNPVTITYFRPDVAEAARIKAMEIANNDEDRLFMVKPNIYIIMNSAKYTKSSRRLIKQLRKGNPFA